MIRRYLASTRRIRLLLRIVALAVSAAGLLGAEVGQVRAVAERLVEERG
jgi:hypothetical protein